MVKRKSLFLRVLALSMLITSLFSIGANAGTVYFNNFTVQSGYVSHSYPSDNSNGWRIVSGTSVKLSYTL